RVAAPLIGLGRLAQPDQNQPPVELVTEAPAQPACAGRAEYAHGQAGSVKCVAVTRTTTRRLGTEPLGDPRAYTKADSRRRRLSAPVASQPSSATRPSGRATASALTSTPATVTRMSAASPRASSNEPPPTPPPLFPSLAIRLTVTR